MKLFKVYTCSSVYIGAMIMILFAACTPNRVIFQRSARTFLQDSSLRNAHTGVAIFDADQSKYLYQFNSNKYFVPASNTKIPTLYAGMKWLGDRLPALRVAKRNDTVFIAPTGDPTFLHSDFATQPAADFLRKHDTVAFITKNWQTEALGYGWAWDDYQSAYMAERSPLPVYGNTIKWKQEKKIEINKAATIDITAAPAAAWNVQIDTTPSSVLRVSRPRSENVFTIRKGIENAGPVEMPFVTNGANTAARILQSTLGVTLIPYAGKMPAGDSIIYSQSADSMYRLLMHRSDNFFAEQTLLMASERVLGVMDEQKLIDTLLKSELNNFPQKPRWVDGSGLSRYNLFTPEDFVWILGKMKESFGMERLTKIFPTGNTGTLRNFYKEDTGFIFAKTGTLSGHVALSGFLVTNKKRMLIFSVLVNNHQSSSVAVRRAVEKYLQQLRRVL